MLAQKTICVNPLAHETTRRASKEHTRLFLKFRRSTRNYSCYRGTELVVVGCQREANQSFSFHPITVALNLWWDSSRYPSCVPIIKTLSQYFKQHTQHSTVVFLFSCPPLPSPLVRQLETRALLQLQWGRGLLLLVCLILLPKTVEKSTGFDRLTVARLLSCGVLRSAFVPRCCWPPPRPERSDRTQGFSSVDCPCSFSVNGWASRSRSTASSPASAVAEPHPRQRFGERPLTLSKPVDSRVCLLPLGISREFSSVDCSLDRPVSLVRRLDNQIDTTGTGALLQWTYLLRLLASPGRGLPPAGDDPLYSGSGSSSASAHQRSTQTRKEIGAKQRS